jgi:hypothetical protein
MKVLKFYADTSQVMNHLFTWRVNNKADAQAALKRFQSKGWKIRAAWYENEHIF